MTFNQFNLNEEMEKKFNRYYFSDIRNKLLKMKFPQQEVEIKQILDELKLYLDKCGLRMPKAKYKYDANDKSTWRFSYVSFFKGKLKGLETKTLNSVN